MNSYFSTFASGFESVIGELLTTSLTNVKIEILLDGLVTYSTDSSVEDIKRIKFFTNSFQLLRLFPKNENIGMEKMMNVVLNDRMRFHSKLPNCIKTFRVIASKENQHVPVNPRLMLNMENLISKNFRLKPNRSDPQVQFWFLTRSEGYGFFGMRLTKHQDYANFLQKGELRPELANILCLLSEPNKVDIFLDPFAGSGAIPLERAKSFPFGHIYIGDIDQKIIDGLKMRVGVKSGITISRYDATKLEGIGDKSIDKIVTDPPWGFFGNKNVDLNKLYNEMLYSFYRVLKNNGLGVILVGDRLFFEDILVKFTDKFKLERKLYILVSGKKAGVYKIRKISG